MPLHVLQELLHLILATILFTGRISLEARQVDMASHAPVRPRIRPRLGIFT